MSEGHGTLVNLPNLSISVSLPGRGVNITDLLLIVCYMDQMEKNAS